MKRKLSLSLGGVAAALFLNFPVQNWNRSLRFEGVVASSSVCGYSSLFRCRWKFRIVLGVTQSSISKPAFKGRLAQELHKEFVSWHCRISWGLSPGPALTVLQEKQWSSALLINNSFLNQSKTLPQKNTPEKWIFWFHPVIFRVCLAYSGLEQALSALLHGDQCSEIKDKELIYSKCNCFILVDLSYLQKKRFEVVAECHSELLVFLKLSQC